MVLLRKEKSNRITCDYLKYTDMQEIGNGTFGKVYIGKYRSDIYAIKKYTYANSSLHITTFRELQILRRLEHKNIISLKEIVVDKYQIYAIFSFYETDLAKLMKRRRLELEEVKYVFRCLISGVSYLHENGIIHRDIKPANVLIGKVISDNSGFNDGDIRNDNGMYDKKINDNGMYDKKINDNGMYDKKINDNGMYDKNSKRIKMNTKNNSLNDEINKNDTKLNGNSLETDNLNRNILKSSLKTDNNIETQQLDVKICDFGMSKKKISAMTQGVVTLWYRAPELLLGTNKYNESIDTWSLGCILFEMLQGKGLFTESTEIEQIKVIASVCGDINSVNDFQNYPMMSKFQNLVKGENKLKDILSGIEPLAAVLIEKMLVLDPSKRIDLKDVLNDPFMN